MKQLEKVKNNIKQTEEKQKGREGGKEEGREEVCVETERKKVGRKIVHQFGQKQKSSWIHPPPSLKGHTIPTLGRQYGFRLRSSPFFLFQPASDE